MSKENFEQKKLTIPPNPNRLERKGDIFMAGEGNGNGGPEHGAPKPPRKTRASRVPPSGASQPDQAAANPPTPEDLTAAWRQFREELTQEGWPVGALGALEQVAKESITRGEMPPARKVVEPVEPVGTTEPKIDLNDAREALSSLDIDTSGMDEDSIRQLGAQVRNLMSRSASASRHGNGADERFGFYLQPEDLAVLRKDLESPLRWLENQFDTIYQAAEQGQELSSPVVSNVQTVVSEAIRYLQYRNEAAVGQFSSEFLIRLNLIFTRSAIEHKQMDSVKQSVERLQSHGLLSALGMEDGRVSVMLSLMGEKLEQARLTAQRQHITPEMMSRLQGDVIREQVDLATKQEIGFYGEVYKGATDAGRTEDEAKALVERQIKRTVRTAYDVFVISQRQAVLVARGHNLSGLPGRGADTYRSDPAALFNMFNLEDLLTEKFGLFNKQAHEFLDRIKIDIATSKLGKERAKGLSDEQLLDYGTRMFRDLWAAPDFFSSGWRIDHIVEKAGENVRKTKRAEVERAIREKHPELSKDQVVGKVEEELSDAEKDLALFLRLKKSEGSKIGEGGRQAIWERIAEIRPEEIIRLYRERARDADGNVSNVALESQLGEFFAGSAFDGYRVYKIAANGSPTAEIDGVATYDKFKQEFGVIVQLVRQNAYSKDFRAIRIGEVGERGLSDQDRATIAKYFGGGAAGLARVDQLQRMYGNFTEVALRGRETIIRYEIGDTLPNGRRIKEGDGEIGKVRYDKGTGAIHDLLSHDKFEDIYTRVLLVDDALLNILDRDQDKNNNILPLSRTWGSEVAQDPLVRNFNDLDHFAKAAGQLIGFVYTENAEERLKAAMTFAEEVSQYNGQGGRAECIRYTVGSFLEISKQSFFWDALGIGKLPFRQAMSGIERIYGPQARPMSRDELRGRLDTIHAVLTGTAAKADTPEERGRASRNAEKYYRELEHMYEVTPEDTVKRRALTLIFYLILAAGAEGFFILDTKSLTGSK